MASFRGLRRASSCILSPVIRSRPLTTSPCLNGGNWNKDWAPAALPKNEEERAAKAKNYGMIPEDYKPMANDGTGFGDYPDLPAIGAHSRNPWEHYDMPHLKRNYGEPMHPEFDALTEDRLDPAFAKQPGYPPIWKQFLILATVLGVFTIICTVPIYRFKPLMPKQYRHGYNTDANVQMVHYTFEPANSTESSE
ncbi:NADH dehydrogenase [ubiquinone] 1 beta subcomplex subunit 8, mitochondrial-like [Mytilus edulis]|uniref:NDUFB8 n=1 Tax=Mytilus edulis TaxID=6550 RepID=A0A8S3USR0_MYTED|nr:NDUFB8 [Mytilus edulis]